MSSVRGATNSNPTEIPKFMEIPSAKQFLYHKIASRCSLLFDSWISAMDSSSDEIIDSMVYALEGGYEGIVSFEAELIERFLQTPIRCCDPKCENKMNYVKNHRMKVWNLNGHIVATPENFMILASDNYCEQRTDPTLNTTLQKVLKKEAPFKELDDYNKILDEVMKFVYNSNVIMNSSLYTVITHFLKNGGYHKELSDELVRNMKTFVRNYSEAFDLNTPVLDRSKQLIAAKQPMLRFIKETDVETETASSVSSGNLSEMPRVTEELRKLQDAIKSVYGNEIVSFMPSLFQDGNTKSRISVQNAIAPHDYKTLHIKPGGLDITKWKFEPPKRHAKVTPKNKVDNPNDPPEDPLQSLHERFKKSIGPFCEKHASGLPSKALWRYGKYMESENNPHAPAKGALSDDSPLSTLLARMRETRIENEKNQEEILTRAGSSKDYPNWCGEGTSSGPSTSSASQNGKDSEVEGPPARENSRRRKQPTRKENTSDKTQKEKTKK